MRFTTRTLWPLAGVAVLAAAVTLSATRRDGSGVAGSAGAGERASGGAPMRIIPGTAAAADWLADLVDPKRIAALPEQIENYSKLPLDPDRWADTPRFPNFTTEQVLAFRPDLVLVSPFTDTSMVARVREAGPRVVTLAEPTTWDELVRAGRELGELLDESDAAEALLERLEARKRSLADREGAAELIVLPYGNFGSGGTTWGRGTTLDLAIELAGYRNAAADAGIEGVDDLSIEVILGLEFDALLMSGSSGQSASEAALRGEIARRGTGTLDTVAAIRDERFLFLPDRLHVSGSQTILDAAESIADQGDGLAR